MDQKPHSEAVKKGLAYLAVHQQPEGGWGQGGGWRSAAAGGRVEGENIPDPADVANTCVATLALLHGEHTPRHGAYADNVRRGLDYVVRQVEQADEESPYVTELRDTQVQSKIGPYVDTFLAVDVLAEAKGQMPDEESERRLGAALDKAIRKLERNQQKDGTWTRRGWAPVVGHGLAASGLTRARRKGARVSDQVLEQTEMYSRSQFDDMTQTFSADGTAGVPLYGTASHLSAKARTISTMQAQETEWRKTLLDTASSPEERALVEQKLQNLREAETAQEQHLSSSYASLQDPGFRQGFGSNGGEEFLSYMNISETLAEKGGPEWEQWDQSISANLERVQNGDGSWTGHHCITGRTFCTATALLVLLAGRAASPRTPQAAHEAARP